MAQAPQATSMPAPTLPGFRDPVHDAQRTFRALLDALARPGIIQSVPSLMTPGGLAPSCAAACLTLLDLETQVWLQPSGSDAIRSWLLFHTGCQFTTDTQRADFALILDAHEAPALDAFCWGTPDFPEASTSLLMQIPALMDGPEKTLQGPGIVDAIALHLPVSPDFWSQWQAMTTAYPLGLDLWCFAQDHILGLPRTARLRPGG